MQTYKEIDLGESAAGSREPQERENIGGVFESPSHHLYILCPLQSKGKEPIGGNLALPMSQKSQDCGHVCSPLLNSISNSITTEIAMGLLTLRC